MRKLFLLLFTLLTLGVNAQELTGCMGISFGDSKSKVRSLIATKQGFEFYKETPTTLSYTNGTFAGRKCIGAVFHFYDNQAHTLVMLVEVENAPKVMDLYQEVVSELSEKYGIQAENAHVYRPPYTEGDGYTASAISNGYVDIMSVFRFADGNVISVTITKGLTVKVTYQHSSLAGTAIDANNKQRAKDY